MKAHQPRPVIIQLQESFNCLYHELNLYFLYQDLYTIQIYN